MSVARKAIGFETVRTDNVTRAAEGPAGHVHLSLPRQDALLLVVRDRSVPLGRLAVLAARASQHARAWLEQQG